MSRSLGWYARRLRVMTPGEVLHRARDRAVQLAWARRQVAVGDEPWPLPGLLAERGFTATLPPAARRDVPAAAAAAVVAAADRVLDGSFEALGTARTDAVDPDWFLDPVTGRRAPRDRLAFRVDHRDESLTGNVKAVWELSRHHHLTVLAAAWWLTGQERYAAVAAAQLRSWWAQNPNLSGIHWTSGIELGVRLTSWAWVRRLLEGWEGAPALFEENHDALRQLRWHQEYLATFRSRGTSANNHAVAEASGALVAACAFPWFEESERWRRAAARSLEHHLDANTFPSGLNREQATDYHRFVTELGLVALAEADRAGHPLGASTHRLLAAGLDAAASVQDVSGRPPRQGDGDEGRALVLDDPDADPWAGLLATGAAVLGARPWWPGISPTMTSTLVGALATPTVVPGRPEHRVSAFPDAGTYLLRTPAADRPELWCLCDGGPQGFGTMAAHGHADALAVEVRVDGVDVLVDPGTYCYHGEPAWRSYFRSTLGHNTVEVDRQGQSVEGGPFLWSRRTDAVTDVAELDGAVQRWSGHHTGYRRLDKALRHDRHVTLRADEAVLEVRDQLTGSGSHALRLAWHLGPGVEVHLDGAVANLSWSSDRTAAPGPAQQPGHVAPVRTATMRLPTDLGWTVHRGECDPPLGWYSPRFGVRVPSTTLVGAGSWSGQVSLTTTLTVSPDQLVAHSRQERLTRPAVDVGDALVPEQEAAR